MSRRAQQGAKRVAVEFPVRRGEAAQLLSLWPALPAVFYAPPHAPRWVALGAAAELRLPALHPRRVRAWADAQFTALDARQAEGFAPRVLGGAGFSAASVGRAPWKGFPGFLFLWPRWTYIEDGQRTRLIFIGESRELSAAAAEQTQIAAALARPVTPNPTLNSQHAVSAARFGRLVTAARAEVRRGRVEKLVVARATRLTASSPWSAAATLRALLRAPGCTAFAVRLDRKTFLGATPERLVLRRGDRVWSEALAGTAAPGEATALRRSAKDLDEHQLVVSELVERLRPLCLELRAPAKPSSRTLNDVVHLLTPLSGRLREDTDLLEVVHRLHPTPAVGGRPQRKAQRWIVAREPRPRGWYTGWVGWLDRAGDGEMSVAIRCGLLRGRDAWIFAGAGIVAASDPLAEYRETAAKFRPMLRALGIAELPQ